MENHGKMEYAMEKPNLSTDPEWKGLPEPDDEVGMPYPSMEGQGNEPIVVPQPPLTGDKTSSVNRILFKELPGLILRRVNDAAEGRGGRPAFVQTLAHYTNYLEGLQDLSNPTIAKGLRAFQKEAEAAISQEQFEGIVKRTSLFLRELRIQRK